VSGQPVDSDPQNFNILRNLLAQRVTIALLACFAYEVLEVFYAEPIYRHQAEVAAPTGNDDE